MERLRLNNGAFIPTIGLGTYKSFSNEVKEAVEYAVDIGYRHIDTAWYYRNEKEVGEAIDEKIKQGVVKREDLFIVTKLWNNFHDRKNVVPKLRESLELLKLDYVDLFLIHWPFAFKEDADTLPVDSTAYSDVDYLETWEGMEDCLSSGLTKSIGLSNFNEEQISRLLQNCKVKPAVNQVEVNPNMNQKSLIRFCREKGIVVTGFCPLGRSTQSVNTPGCPVSTILDPRVEEMAGKYGKTSAQVVLLYLVTSLGICVIPKSVTKSRIFENFHIFDFELSPEDICYLDSCNTNQRVSAMMAYRDHKYYPF